MRQSGRARLSELVGSTRRRVNPGRGRRCAHCGRPFSALTTHARYCSDHCRSKSWRERRDATRPRWRCCTVCGCSFSSERANRLYCSAACSQWAYRQRRAVPRKTAAGESAFVGAGADGGGRPSVQTPEHVRVQRLVKRTQAVLHQMASARDPERRSVHEEQLERTREDLHHSLARLSARNAVARANLTLAREHAYQNWVRFGPSAP